MRIPLIGVLLAAASSVAAQGCPVELQTLYAANNGGSVGGAVYFDLTVTNATTITAFCVNTTVTVGNPIGLTVYTNTTVPTWVGNHTNTNWTQVAIDDGTATAAGANVGSNIPLAVPLTLLPGTYPMALVGTGTGGSFNHRYTNGNGSNQNYADGNLAIALGGASNVPFSGSAFNPRIWNGSIKYLSADALVADFSATFTNCSVAPLMVAFSDQSCTTDLGGITSWAWDFGDGNSSTMQNPTHTYTMPGSYGVSLTVTDGSHAPASRTRTNFVVVAFPNDECTNAIPVIGGLNGPFNNLCATDSTPAIPCGGTASSDVWFRYDHLGCDTMVEANLCTGTNYDSKIEVLSGDCAGLTSIACNDDACGLQSRVTWLATQGASYYIRVGGFAGARGVFELEITVPGSATMIQAGCGGTTMTVSSNSASGNPEIGSTTTFVVNGFGLPMIWFDFTIPTPGFPQTLCSPPAGACVLACDFDYSVPITNPLNLPIPNDPVLCGACFCVQAALVISLDGCDIGGIPYTVSDAFEIIIGC